ncbi:MAG: nucleotide sugar dehydrogenase, partial [Candidatus Bipolaricaulota bacterium]
MGELPQPPVASALVPDGLRLGPDDNGAGKLPRYLSGCGFAPCEPWEPCEPYELDTSTETKLDSLPRGGSIVDSMNVVIVGAGYVGLTTGVSLAYAGHQVTVVEIEPDKLATLQSGKSPIHEHALEELMREAGSRLSFSASAEETVGDAELVMIAVGTPCRPDGQAENRYVEEAARQVAQGLREVQTCTLVVKSTVPLGTNRRVAHVVERTVEERGLSPRTTVHVASNPEFLREGTALQDMLYPDRIVVGADDPSTADVLRRLYRPILEQTFEPPPYLP